MKLTNRTPKTKRLKHRIYTEALKIYKSEKYGLCAAIDEAILALTGEYSLPGGKFCPYTTLKNYPEIYKHLPSYFIENMETGYAWNKSNTKIRIKIFKQAIKETE